MNTLDEVLLAAEALVREIDLSNDCMAFDEHGSGPFSAIENGGPYLRGPSPIRELAERLREALLSHERITIARARRSA